MVNAAFNKGQNASGRPRFHFAFGAVLTGSYLHSHWGGLSSPRSQPRTCDFIGSTSTTNFSTWAHLMHSNVRKSSAVRAGKMRESTISDWQFGQGGRGMDVKSEDDCNADMALPSTGGSTTLSVTGGAWWRDGDATRLTLRVTMRCSVLIGIRL